MLRNERLRDNIIGQRSERRSRLRRHQHSERRIDCILLFAGSTFVGLAFLPVSIESQGVLVALIAVAGWAVRVSNGMTLPAAHSRGDQAPSA
jgi:hypothetical protein